MDYELFGMLYEFVIKPILLLNNVTWERNAVSMAHHLDRCKQILSMEMTIWILCWLDVVRSWCKDYPSE